ncbi:MAG: hypothetical protein IKQ35_01225 [Bacilli bacterium]|nr:hypothetical protein [Bacilli bacterium]
MKRLLCLILFFIIGLLLGFVIGNKDKMFSPRTKEVKISYETTKKVEIDKSKDVVVDAKFKDNKNLVINISNVKKDTIKIKVPVKNNSKKDKALITFKSKYNKEIYDVKINPQKIELDKNKSTTVIYEITIKDTSKIDKDKLNIDISLVATAL